MSTEEIKKSTTSGVHHIRNIYTGDVYKMPNIAYTHDNQEKQMSTEEIKKSTTRSVHYIRNIYKRVRNSLEDVLGMSPREKELAMQNIEQSEMWAVRAVYKNTNEKIAKEKSNASENTTVSHGTGIFANDSSDAHTISED